VRKITKIAIVLTLVSACFTAPAAYAIPTLALNDFVNPTVYIADGSALDSNSLVGAVTYIGTLGIWTVNVSTGIGSAILGPSRLDLNSVNTSTAGTGTLYIVFSEDNQSLPVPGFIMTFGGTLSGATNASVLYDAYADDNNGLFIGQQKIGQLGPFGPGPFSGQTEGYVSVSDPYSLSQRFIIFADGGITSFSGDGELFPVPEPATMLLLGSGLLGLAGFARKRFKK